jgi:hypothetical protein
LIDLLTHFDTISVIYLPHRAYNDPTNTAGKDLDACLRRGYAVVVLSPTALQNLGCVFVEQALNFTVRGDEVAP